MRPRQSPNTKFIPMDLDNRLKELEEEEARLARQRKELMDQKKKQEALEKDWGPEVAADVKAAAEWAGDGAEAPAQAA